MNTGLARIALASLSILLCGSAPVAAISADGPEVTVSQPLVREIVDFEDFTGRTEASTTVDLRARVTGYLVKIHFKDGADVKKGDLLFEIDPRPYQAELKRAEAGLSLAEATMKPAAAEFERVSMLFKTNAASQAELDKAAAEKARAEAGILAAKAAVEVAKLNLAYTKVTAPINGRIGRRLVDPGNVVTADMTTVSTLVALDPMYVFIDVDERTLLRLRQANRHGKGKVTIGLVDEKARTRNGTLDFVDNRVDPKTGTIRIRAVFANADGDLKPGMFVRGRLPTGEPYKALLVPASTLKQVKGLPCLYVVNDKNTVERRTVLLGRIEGDLQVIKEGVKATDWIITGSLKGIQAEMVVKPKKAP